MDQQSRRRERIEETTVGDIDGWMVTVANIMTGSYVSADRSAHEGMSAKVGLYDEDRGDHGETRVGPGSALTIRDQRWRVESVHDGENGGNGYIVLVHEP